MAIAVATFQRLSAVAMGVVLLLVFTQLSPRGFAQELDGALKDVRRIAQEITAPEQQTQTVAPLPPQLPPAVPLPRIGDLNKRSSSSSGQ